MSHFFENLGNDLSSKKNIAVQKNVHKKESKDKMEELEEEVANLTITPKNIDNIIKNLKQHHKTFNKNGLPDFVIAFLQSGSEKGNSKVKSHISKFMGTYNAADISNGKNFDNDDKATGEAQFKIKEDEKKQTNEKQRKFFNEEKLNNAIIKITTKEEFKNQEKNFILLLEKSEEINEKAKILLTLLTFYLKKKYFFSKAVDTIRKLVNIIKDCEDLIFLEIDIKKVVVNNIDNYLGYLFPFIDADNAEEFKCLLDEIIFINTEKIFKKQLIFEFFVLNQNSKNKDEIFKLLYLIRNNEYEKAMEYYNKQINLFDKVKPYENKFDSNYVKLEILNELGNFSFVNMNYKFAFEILQLCYFNKAQKNENILYILTIILEDEICDEKFYDVFYENLRCLEQNIFLMKSNNKKEEIFRAFYYLCNYDYESCCDILENVEPNINLRNMFKDRVYNRLNIRG
ncbi:hypothetical protein COBT_001994 [Conglomerata obtusa]